MKIKSLVITAVLSIAVLCSAGFVNAQAADNSALIAQLQAQIQSLMQQIQQLIAQQQGGQTWCHTFNTNLRIGDTGDEVDALKTALQKNSVYSGIDIGLPNFTEGVASAVSEFQEKYASEILTPSGLKRGTGYAGPSTRAKLNKLYSCNQNNNTNTNNSTTKPVASSWIKMESPNGGENWEIGKSYYIQWGYQNINYTGAKTAIHLLNNNGVYRTLYNFSNEGNAANLARFWTVPSDIPVGSYKMQVVLYDRPEDTLKLDDTSDNYFNIVMPTTQSSFCVPAGEDLGQVSSSNVLQCCAGLIAYNPDPVKNYAWRGICQNPSNLSSTITITSPNEGDQWKQGSTHNITWSTTGLSSTDKVYITVTAPCMGGSSCPLYNVTPVNGDVSALSGSYSWTIPSSIGVYNSYIISVTLRTNNSIQGGKVFSVVVP